MQYRNQQAGFSLVEILLVLGIIAILAIAAFIVYPQAQDSNRANTAQTNLISMAAGIKNLYGSTRDYASLTTELANKAGVVPTSMNGGNPDAAGITSAWSAPVDIGPGAVDATTGAAPTFTITFQDMPGTICAKLVPGVMQNFKKVYVPASAATPLSVGPAAAVVACGTATVDVKFEAD